MTHVGNVPPPAGTKPPPSKPPPSKRAQNTLLRGVSEERCSFCAKWRREVKALITSACSPEIFICNECVGLAAEMLGEQIG